MNGIRVLENIGRRTFHGVWLLWFVKHSDAGDCQQKGLTGGDPDQPVRARTPDDSY